MKFTWGTGIFLFLVLFLCGATVFIIFASRQQVNLVHKDYYEKGVDHTEQMHVNARSKAFGNSFATRSTDKFFIVDVEKTLASKIDSGTIHMYRPSDKNRDITVNLKSGSEESFIDGFKFDKRTLLNGRYILKFTWYTNGLRYEINKPVSVQ